MKLAATQLANDGKEDEADEVGHNDGWTHRGTNKNGHDNTEGSAADRKNRRKNDYRAIALEDAHR